MSRKKKTAAVTTAPAVHDDRLWDIDKLPDGKLHNLSRHPIDAKSLGKSGYKKLLNEGGLRMKNQQESAMGPELAPVSIPDAAPIPVAPELSEGTARVVAAFSRVLSRYGFRESLWCDLCFQQNLNSGCRITYGNNHHSIAIKCGCSLRRYTSVMGLGYTSTTAITSTNETTGAILKADGSVNVPTTILDDDDAKLMQRYYKALSALMFNNTLDCNDCGEMCQQNVTDDEINIVCACRIRYWKGTRH